MIQDPDFNIVEKVLSGDKLEFSKLHNKHRPLVVKIASQFVKEDYEVNEICQKTFINAYNSLAAFRKEAKFSTWIYRIAENTSKNFVKAKLARSRREASLSYLESLENTSIFLHLDSPENELITEEMKVLLHDTIESLPFDLRRIFELREIEQYSYQHIANKLDIPIGTVRSRIFRAREKIENGLECALLNTC